MPSEIEKTRKSLRFKFWRWVWVTGNKISRFGGKHIIAMHRKANYKDIETMPKDS